MPDTQLVYTQLVYSTIHRIKPSDRNSDRPASVLDYAKKVFQFATGQHQEIIDSITKTEVILYIFNMS